MPRKPHAHPAYAAFMAIWNAPMDQTLGSRAAADEREMAVVYAAQQFAKAEAPVAVRDALVRFLRTKASLGGAWNFGGQALRVLCETDAHVLVAHLRALVDTGATREEVLAFLAGCRGEPIEVLGAILAAGWGRSPGGLDTSEWKAAVAACKRSKR